jgi:type IV pilus assembly protein PilV
MSEPRNKRVKERVPGRADGFTLVEVMVSLVICAIGLLGLAKLQSLVISSTAVSASRSLAAIEASSLAATMHANTAYWASVAPTTPITVSVTGTASAPVVSIVSSDTTLSTPVTTTCSTPGTSSCAPNVMAAFDLQAWAQALGAVLPSSFSTITCATVATAPVTCTIQIQWTESAQGVNVQQTNLSGLQTPTYILYVQP